MIIADEVQARSLASWTWFVLAFLSVTVKPAVLGCPAPVPLGQSGNTPWQEWMKPVDRAGPVTVLHGIATDVARNAYVSQACSTRLLLPGPANGGRQERLSFLFSCEAIRMLAWNCQGSWPEKRRQQAESESRDGGGVLGSRCLRLSPPTPFFRVLVFFHWQRHSSMQCP